MSTPFLIADAAEVAIMSPLAEAAFGSYDLQVPEGIDIEDIHDFEAPGNELGYVARLSPQRATGIARRFIRADVAVTAKDDTDPDVIPESDVDRVLSEAESRVESEFFLESDITKAGLGAWKPYEDFRVGDLVNVRIFDIWVSLPVTRIEPIISDGDIVDWRVHVGGQLLSDDQAREVENATIQKELIQDRRDLAGIDAKATKAVKDAAAAQSAADTADGKADTAESKADAADGKAGQAQEKADAADEKAGQAQEKADALEIQLDPIMDFAQSYMPTGLGFNGSGRLPFRVQRGPAKGVGVENDGMRLLGAGAWQITCEVRPSWVRIATRTIVYRVNCYTPQGDLYAYQEFLDDTSDEAHTVAFGADFVVPEPDYFVTVHVNSVGIGRKHLGGWAFTRLVAKRWSSEFINPPDGGASETEPAP